MRAVPHRPTIFELVHSLSLFGANGFISISRHSCCRHYGYHSSSSALSKLNQIIMPNKSRQKSSDEIISVVGPDCIEVLQGTLFDGKKSVTVVLCGESHEDAIDVTRKGGRFDAKEGWIEIKKTCMSSDYVQIFAAAKKSLPVEKSKEWAKSNIERMDLLGSIILLWVQDNTPENRVSKGKAFLLGLISKDSLDEDDEDFDYWIDPFGDQSGEGSIEGSLPSSVREWVVSEDTAPLAHQYLSYEWGDLDFEAFELNKRRLTDEEIETSELDQIIENRKKRLQRDNIWTWDDWFAHIRKQSPDVDVELVLESSVPPWELSLHRPSAKADPSKAYLPPAAECIRCMYEDEDGCIEEDYDPSADGIGSYLDYVYRRFMEEMIEESSNKGDLAMGTWLHCVDVRDLGCQAACHSDSVKGMWKNLLTLEETQVLLGDNTKKNKFINLEPDSANEYIKFVPECRCNPERVELEKMRSTGKLMKNEDDGCVEEEEPEEDEFTYPSFEGFFGQNTDFLYYSPHVKLCYSPFLAKCANSLANWEHFFTDLFLGGTIPDALSLLDLEQSKDHIYVRSPIIKVWNKDTSAHDYRHRDDGEHYITYPYFPFIFYMFARGSSPPRTWSSNLFAKVCTHGEEAERIALATRQWTLDRIKQSYADPKGSDDPECGGEWFEAFLYAVHRDIYEDIDLSDPSVLLQRNKMKSLTSGRKYNIGKIKIPSCGDGFDEIKERFKMELDVTDTLVTPRIEVMASILIDIWMSNLVDFTAVLKIADIASKTKNNNRVMVVCYMGTAHTRAVADFYTNKMGFKKKAFVGKTDWGENEPRILKLPKALWNIAELFP